MTPQDKASLSLTKQALEMAMRFAEANSTTKISTLGQNDALTGQEVFNACEEALQSEASITKELQFLYDDLTEEYIAELDDKTVLIISGGNRARWFNKIRGIWYE